MFENLYKSIDSFLLINIDKLTINAVYKYYRFLLLDFSYSLNRFKKQSLIHAEDLGRGEGVACALKNHDFPTVLHENSHVLNRFLLFQITIKPVTGENFPFKICIITLVSFNFRSSGKFSGLKINRIKTYLELKTTA